MGPSVSRKRKTKTENIDEVKILLLGLEGSGKSTIFQQIKIFQNKQSLKMEELVSFRTKIYSICVSHMVSIVESHEGPLSSVPSQEASIKFLQLVKEGIPWSNEMGSLIKILWSNRGIRKTYDMRVQKFHLKDTADYFFDEIERISLEDYVPTVKDVIHIRTHSTGIEEVELRFEDLNMVFVDFGSENSHPHRKLPPCYNNVTVVIFCVAINEYDQILEDSSNPQYQLNQAIQMFQEISNSNLFKNSTIIMLLNKKDLFEKKIKNVPLTEWMSSYQGGSIQDAMEFIKQQFLNKTTREIYTHFSCGLELLSFITFIINTVREGLLKNDLNL